jgi:glycosyltransferase involved in cell wall biosynthesis
VLEPIVDVGIPTHGRPRYLREAVESVLAQTFDRWRLTISENGHGGGDVEAILDPFLADPRVRLVATGAAVSPARNATNAVQAGRAPYVAILHDDDRWDPGFLARRVAFLESNPTCGFVFSHCNYIGAEGNAAIPFATGVRDGIQPRAAFLRSLYRRSVIAMPTVLSRRAAYEAVGPAFRESLQFDDYEMWLRIAARFDVGFLDVRDASFRIHTAQRSYAGLSRMGEHRLELLDEVDRWLPPDFPVVDKRRARSGAYLRAAYDAFGRRERRRAVAYLGAAFRTYPLAVFDPKMAGLASAAMRFRADQRALWKPVSTNDRKSS